METQQKTLKQILEEARQRATTERLDDKGPQELAELTVEVRESINALTEKKVNIEDILKQQLPRKGLLTVKQMVRLTDGSIAEATVEVRHKSSERKNIPDGQIIRLLAADYPEDYKRLVDVDEIPAHIEKNLDKKALMKAIEEDEALVEKGAEAGISGLRRFISISESDWIEVRGLK